MNKINHRIKQLIEVYGKNKNKTLADRLGVNESVIRSYVTDMRQPKADLLAQIVLTLDVNADWLLTGRGEMTGSSEQVANDEVINGLIELLKERDKTIAQLYEQIVKLKK